MRKMLNYKTENSGTQLGCGTIFSVFIYFSLSPNKTYIVNNMSDVRTTSQFHILCTQGTPNKTIALGQIVDQSTFYNGKPSKQENAVCKIVYKRTLKSPNMIIPTCNSFNVRKTKHL